MTVTLHTCGGISFTKQMDLKGLVQESRKGNTDSVSIFLDNGVDIDGLHQVLMRKASDLLIF